MYCESCGSYIPDNQAFCANCGSPAPQPVAQPSAQPVAQTVAQPVVQQVAQPVAQPVQVQPVAVQPVVQQVQPVYQQPVYAQPVVVAAVPAAQQAKPKNGAASAGLVFGILSFLFSWIPVFNFFTTGILGLMGLIFSIVGIAKGRSGGRGKAIAGLVLTLLGGIITAVVYAFIFSAVGSLDYEDIISEIDLDDLYSTSYSETDNNVVFDNDFFNFDNESVSGVLHMDGYRVDF